MCVVVVSLMGSICSRRCLVRATQSTILRKSPKSPTPKLSSERSEKTADVPNPGKVHVEKDRMYVETADGMIRVRSLQLQGRKRMDAAAFLLGNHPDQQILGA